MPRIKTLLCAAVAAFSASAAVAAPWGPPNLGDLILGFQAESGEGTGDNVIYNLGPATTIRDTPNPGVVVNLSSKLAATYGNDWYDRSDLWFGAFNIRSNQTTGSTAGDPNPTAYFTKASATNARAGADLYRFETAFSAFTVTNNLNTSWTPFSGLIGALSGLTADQNGVAVMNSVTHSVAWNNGWWKFNQFVNGAAAGTQGTAFSVFSNGIQNNFGKTGQPAVRLDLQRYERGVTTGATYVATIEIAPNGNVSVVNTQVTSYNLNFSVNPVGSGTVSGATNGQSFTSGTSASLTATANAGYRFSNWSGDGSGTSSSLSVLMNGNKTVVANFVQTFPLTLSATTNGTISVTGGNQSPYAAGSSVELTATPANGYTFTGWTGDASGTSPTTITMDAAKTVGATFAPDLSDEDSDGVSKFTEVQLGTNPADTNTVPALPAGFRFKGGIALTGAEISAFDPASDRLFVTSNAGLQVVDLSNPASPALVRTINLSAAPYSAVSNDVSSVAVYDGKVAAAVLNPNKEQPGSVVFLEAAGSNTHLSTKSVGCNPDMVVFAATSNGLRLLVANEGEYIAGGAGITPGSISIIGFLDGFTNPSVSNLGFSDKVASTLKGQTPPVRIFGAETAENDLEPEYIAVSPDGNTAMITLQENNAVAILDIRRSEITDIVGLGTKDFSTLLADFSDQDGPGGSAIAYLRTGNPVSALYLPDGITSFESGGQTYYITANEGDDRDDFLVNPNKEKGRVSALGLNGTTFPAAATLTQAGNLGRLNVTKIGANGNALATPLTEILAYGGRSFSILDSTGKILYDSADLIERTIASYGKGSSQAIFDDVRSDDKGPEPENVVVASLGERLLAFVALERSNGVLVVDITGALNPQPNVSVVGFLRNAGDISPEGLMVIPAADSPSLKMLVVVSNEVSNTVSVFEIEPVYNLTITTTSNGSIAVQNGLNNPYLNGTEVQLTATAASGYAFTGWTGAASGSTQNPLPVTMNQDKEIGATFEPLYTVTVNRPVTGGKPGEVGGSVTGLTGGGIYVNGANAQLTATAFDGYVFSGWTVTGAGSNPAPSTSASLSVPVNGNKTVTATFARNNAPSGKSVFSVFQEASLKALASRWEVGQDVDLDLSFFFNNIESGYDISVVNLPPGLKWVVEKNRTTGALISAKVTGKITGEIEGAQPEIRKLDNKKKPSGTPLVWDFDVAPYRLTGRYEVLLKDANGLAVGKSLLTVTGPGTYTATLDLLGQSTRIAAKGEFAPFTAPYTVLARFAAGRAGVTETFVKFTISPTSDAASASAGSTNAATGIADGQLSQGFRLHKAGREPRVAVTVALQNASTGSRSATPPTPGGQGYATGVFDAKKNQLTLAGALGDATAFTTGLNVSQSRQAIVFVQPYRGGAHTTGSYFAGVLTLGDLGQPVRGGGSDVSLTPELKWTKAAVTTDKSYKGGFGPLTVKARVDRWITSGTGAGVALSLGLTDRKVYADYQDLNKPAAPSLPAGKALPGVFSLRNNFTLVRVAPVNSVNSAGTLSVKVGSAKVVNGSFTGTMTLDAPAGLSTFTGVLLQNEIADDSNTPVDESKLVGTGLIKLFTNTAKDFETATISLFNADPNAPSAP